MYANQWKTEDMKVLANPQYPNQSPFATVTVILPVTRCFAQILRTSLITLEKIDLLIDAQQYKEQDISFYFSRHCRFLASWYFG
jgi:hypothetical protein